MEKTRNTKKQHLLSLVEGAMMLALAWGLDFVCGLLPFNQILWPAGGSLTLGMIPLVYYSFRHGSAWGLGAGFVFSGLQMLMGWYTPPANTWWAVLLCVLLDYVLAFAVLGCANLFAKPFGKKHRLLGYGLGAGIVCLIRCACSILSGAVLWGSYAPEGMNVWVYTVGYNGSYMLPNAILTAVLIVLLCKAIDPQTLKPMKKVSK